MLELSCNVM